LIKDKQQMSSHSQNRQRTAKPIASHSQSSKRTAKPTDFHSQSRQQTAKPTDFHSQSRQRSAKQTDFHSQSRQRSAKPTDFHSQNRQDSAKQTDFHSQSRQRSAKPTDFHSQSRQDTAKPTDFHSQSRQRSAKPTDFHSQNRQDTPELSERVQKVLARAGLGSRREIETWIQEGRVKVNQHIATLGDRVSARDEISLNGRKIRKTDLHTAYRQQILCYHKPIGEVCTRHDDEGRTTIFERLPSPKHGRWISIGRLDLNTAGLLLLTTDGDLAHRLMHPSYEIEREYAVRILGEVDLDMLTRLREGIELEDGMAHFKRVHDAGGSGANHWYHVTLMEGRKHEVRRLWESQGVTVSRLMRIRFGPVYLPKGLRTGHFVDLDNPNQKALLQVVGMKASSPFHQAHNPFLPRRGKNRINSKPRYQKK